MFNALVFIWLKFNFIWKYSRCWALWDGIECPENMNRCIMNNFTFQMFWRSWHRGFNQWLIRYLYIPLGGTKYVLLNMWVVFTFVAVWHDMNINLVIWAWFICLCFIPEICLAKIISLKRFQFLWKMASWKFVCAIVLTLNNIFICLSNQIGFGCGLRGARDFYSKIQNEGALSFITIILYCVPWLYMVLLLNEFDERGF